MNSLARKDLVKVIGERALHTTDKDALVQEIAAFLTTEHHQIDLGSLTRDIMQYRLSRGIVEAIAVSAHELTAEVLKDIEVLLKEHFPQANKIIVDSLLDSSVIGGIRIELPQENLDLSVKSKLNLFKRLVAEERK
ncbi:F0F1 ATP synthase subunit delta [Candidatus Saccharibacteria bacterium]|nr:F0F1 ATP synthase subunit delta [Candidatus Saccharibacteria bacterium]